MVPSYWDTGRYFGYILMWLVYKKCKEKLNFIMEEEKERKGAFTDRRWARAGAILTELSSRA